MSKIVVISCTNRLNSNTLKISKVYEEILKSTSNSVKLLDFCLLPKTIAFTEVFGERSDFFSSLINEYISNSDKFVFVVPEYNGSFPGILKSFLDSVPPKEWTNKDACLVGISTGRAGNLRGLDHLSGILSYLKMHVYHNKLPISLVDKLLNEEGKIISEDQLEVYKSQLNGFLLF